MVECDCLTVESDLKYLIPVQEWFKQFCVSRVDRFYWLHPQIYPLNLALAEGFSNAVRHAHRILPPDTPIEIALTLWEDHIEIRVWDYGQPFDPDTLQEPVLGTLRQGGYGWFLLRRLSDQVTYQRCPDERNCLVIVKHKNGKPHRES
jgi:serine/threonine-protein kinase RsbW